MAIEYAHTNIVAEDWEMVSRFYQDVFGCIPVPPHLPNAGHLTFVYMTDPEGDILEIQSWT